jgi:hypothetical protein
MNYGLLAAVLIGIVTFTSFGQEMPVRLLVGTYYEHTGLPGRTIKQDDGSEIHLMPVTHTESFLRLKRFGKASISTTDHRMDNFQMKFKYSWQLESDTLILRPRGGGAEQKYVIVQDSGRVRYLRSTIDEHSGYSRRDK